MISLGDRQVIGTQNDSSLKLTIATGYEALIINTHSFQGTTFLKSYSGPGDYTGTAAVVGAGVQGRALFRKAFAQTPPVVIVGGECPVRCTSIQT